ncbi:hypothetical protein ACFVU2_17370 [Leifsonia sp. NPDC058194]|uniref:hypothetical protein n=1 Tax=Leifsonia sp. NPDC058194 TaxID=3346374 RepID=UPI0036DDD52A
MSGQVARGSRAPRGLARVRHETLDTVFGYVYAILMVDLLLVVANLPLAVMLFAARDALQAWPLVLLLSVTVSPSLAGAFEVYRTLGDGHPQPFAAFWRGYRRRGLAAGLIGSAATALVGFVLYDAAVVAGTVWAALLGPTLLVAAVIGVATTITAITGLTVFATASPRAILKAALYVAVRRWYVSVLALVLVGLSVLAVLMQPVLGALAPGLLLYAVFANAHYGFRQVLRKEG